MRPPPVLSTQVWHCGAPMGIATRHFASAQASTSTCPRARGARIRGVAYKGSECFHVSSRLRRRTRATKEGKRAMVVGLLGGANV